ncbi:MAG: alanine racemase [Candidatus Nanopelagicales bacterium]|nr:alanine racemase [Candidatus Nanopelagicales bacterium]
MSNLRGAYVDLAAIRDNVKVLQNLAKNSEVMAVVKADAYGHGLVPVAKAARQGGATWLGTALLEEAISLRNSGDSGRILTWLGSPNDKWQECIDLGIDISVSSIEIASGVIKAAKKIGKKAKIHIKVDTGLGRNGVMPNDLADLTSLLEEATANGLVEVVAVWTHFALADAPSSPTIAKQLEVLDASFKFVESRGFKNLMKHAANSAATLTSPHTHFDLVRPGIAVYGITPGGEVGKASEYGLRPAMTLKAQAALVKDVPAGHGISYGAEYVTKQNTKIALIPLGYADGIPRIAGNKGPVLANGKKFSVAGRVCMDQFVIDIGDLDFSTGDEVILFGDPAQNEPDVEEWAKASQSIGYEIVTRLGSRVPRIYLNEI